MDDGLKEHDPYRNMETAESDIRPEFLGGKGDSVESTNKVESDTPEQEEQRDGGGSGGLYRKSAKEELASNEEGASGNLKESSATKNDLKKDAASGGGKGLYSKSQGVVNKKVGGLFGGKKKLVKLSAFAVIAIVLFGTLFTVVSHPTFLIGNLDFNLMDSTGFSGTVGILEEQAEYVEAEMAKNGEMPANLANDLVAAGLDVGQVTASGDFVRTNKYIADIEDLDEVAVVGSGFYRHGDEGELAFLFEGELIEADDFVLAVETNPRLYNAFSEGTNISSKYYYGDDVNDVYADLGISRNNFGGLEPTGDSKHDQENFDEALKEVLDDDKTSLNGGYDCVEEGEGCDGAKFSGEGEEIVNSFSKKNQSAAQLLSSAVASTERNKSMRAFVATEEPLQRARIDGDGPANEIMNVLTDDSKKITYNDVYTGEEVEREESILETPNFVAAASGGGYDKNEGANFSRDRVLHATAANDSGLINKTVLSSDGKSKIKIGVKAFTGEVDLNKAASSAQIGISDANSDTYRTAVGANYIVSGGAELRSVVDNKAIYAMPADQQMAVTYKHKVDERLAKKAEAERATKSPFDISSPYTFMGSIAHSMASAMVKNRLISKPSNIISTIGTVVGDSTKSLVGGAIADGEDESDSSLLDTFGSNCRTSTSVGAAGNLYCSQISVIYTGYMSKNKDYWDEYKKTDEDYYHDYVTNTADRWSPVGVRDAYLCEHRSNPTDGLLGKFILKLFGKCFGLEINNDDGNILTGEAYVMSNDKHSVKKASAYSLYDTVSSLLSEGKTTARTILEEYRKENPLDNSEAGRIARFSGMTKRQAEIALAYADYLTMIARYDASTRYAFGTMFEGPEKSILIEHSDKLNGDLFCFWQKQTEYDDVRNRSFAA